MRLTRLEMLGFKSFMTKVELRFEEGITAVLGPNGCGKSNIVDALRWVLGAQSPKLLRGSKMENVIFDGTKNRAPMGFAEVAVTFSGASETLPVEWDEITIKRRVTRSGGSDYFLNGQPYRLHEIRDLLAGTGLGNHAYAVIERDMVEEVLSDAGEKRRLLFEEASGVMKYKLRRKESLSKLAATEADLTRLSDILEELGRSVRSLKYQMGRARSYQRLQHELHAAERHRAAVLLHGYWRQDRDLAQRLEGLGDAARAGEGRIARREEEAARRQAELLEREGEHQAARDRLETEALDYRKREEELAVLDEKARTEERQAENLAQDARAAADALERLAEERESLQAERSELAARREALATELASLERESRDAEARYQERRALLQREKQLHLDFARSRAEAGGEVERLRERRRQAAARLDELDAERARLGEQDREVADHLAALSEREDAAREALAAAESERASTTAARDAAAAAAGLLAEALQGLALRRETAAARLELLERLQREGAGLSEGTRWLLEAKAGTAGLRGSLGERLRVAPEHREAVAAALDRALDALVLDEAGPGLDWLDELRREERGRALLVALADARDAASPAGPAPAGFRPLADLVDVGEDLRPALQRLLAGCYLAPDAAAARRAVAADPAGRLRAVTAAGTLFAAGGLMAGGSAGAESGALGRGEEIAALGRELADLAPEEARRREERDARAVERDAAAARLAGLEDALAERRRELQERTLERGRLEARHARLAEEGEALAAERLYLERQADSLRQALAAAESELARLSDQTPREDLDLAALEVEVADRERERESLRTRLGEKRLELAAAKGRLENLALREENLERTRAGQWSRRQKSEEGAAACRQQTEALRARGGELRGVLAERQVALEAGRAEARALLDDIQTRRERVQELQGEVRRLQGEQREQDRARHEIEMERNTLRVKQEDLRERVRESYGADLDPAADPEASGDWRPPEGVSVEERVASLQKRIARLGTVNLLALEEYEEKNERYQFLLAQKEDLDKARAGLLETIQRINQEARQRFNESFRVIRKNFIAIFTTLFEGGEADLAFSTDEDPLQAEIVITAKPREKNISSVQLLSTGEKTLTALSLLFAVYLSKPSPFCVFDEVDAPLDDANIARFLRMVREFSARTQFILITHNKRTMEVAGHLYGVTMEESGVSKIVSVAFADVPDDLEAAAAASGGAA
ncbi:MAG: chromosome segregation protein SMC [Candidatus Krumholzibacteriota bacterium]|nr:chromosome segregation protein SMC [Candidatus Krumholzibacteriota bacterium]